MLYFCNGNLSRLFVQLLKKRNYASVGQPCTDSVQILLQICSKSEPNVITGTSPIKAKDTGGPPSTCSLSSQFPIRFSTFLFYKNETITEQKLCFFYHPPYQCTQTVYSEKLFILQKQNKHRTKTQLFYHPPYICTQNVYRPSSFLAARSLKGFGQQLTFTIFNFITLKK